ncbi:hypothetical protein GQ457_02G029580 [Hibiscus cannabinus]
MEPRTVDQFDLLQARLWPSLLGSSSFFSHIIKFEYIIETKNNLDIRYCICTGAYGSVYRAQLPSGNFVALKKLHRKEVEVPAFDKSFKNEAKTLSEIRHMYNQMHLLIKFEF